jgi:hypothetical protein
MCSLTLQADVDTSSLISYQKPNAEAEQAQAAYYSRNMQFAYLTA